MKTAFVLSLVTFLLNSPLSSQEKHDEGSVTIELGPPTWIKPVIPGTDSLVREITRAKQSGDIERAQRLMHILDSLYGIETSIQTQPDPSTTIEPIGITENPLHSFVIAETGNKEKRPFLQVSSNGAQTHVAFEKWNNGNPDSVFTSRFSGSWTFPWQYRISNSTRRLRFPSLAYVTSDSFIVVYDAIPRSTGIGGDIHAAILHNNGFGGRTLIIDDDLNFDIKPCVASDEVPPAYVYAAYHTTRKVTVRRSLNSGRTWSSDVFSYTVSNDIWNVWIAVDRDTIQNIHLCWSAGDTLYVSRSTNYGANWTVPARFYHVGMRNVSNAAVNGKVVVAYCKQYSGDDWDVWYYYSTNGSSWGRTPVDQALTFEACATVSAEPGSGANYFWLFYRAGPRRDSADIKGALIPISNPSSFSPLIHVSPRGRLRDFISDDSLDFVSTAAQPSGIQANVAWAYRYDNTDDFDLRSSPGIWVGVTEIGNEIPERYSLSPNYPNPFNPATMIRFEVAHRSNVELHIFNTLGQRVATLVNEEKEPGGYEVVWDGRNDAGQQVGSGVYFYRLRAGEFVQTKKLMLLR